jgi:hypothetical protein
MMYPRLSFTASLQFTVGCAPTIPPTPVSP